MKKFNPKFSVGSLFICSKCGQGFSNPAPDQAEKLKSELRTDLKSIEAHTKVRVMVSGCLGVCEPDQQTFGYYPNTGAVEIYTSDAAPVAAKADILNLIKSKI